MKNTFSFPQFAIDARPADLRIVILLFPALVLTLVHREACGVDALPDTGLFASETARVWLYYMYSSVLFGLVPALVGKVLLRDSFVSYGLRLGDWKFGLVVVVLLLAGFTALCFSMPGVLDDLRAVYPVDKGAMESPLLFLRHALLRVLLFYTAWEFLFRGFLLQGLRGSVSDTTAILISTLPSALWHIGYPSSELYSSVAGGLLFGWLAVRTESLLWPFALHAGIGVITDLVLTLTR